MRFFASRFIGGTELDASDDVALRLHCRRSVVWERQMKKLISFLAVPVVACGWSRARWIRE